MVQISVILFIVLPLMLNESVAYDDGEENISSRSEEQEELALIPDINGQMYQINLTEREIQYAKTWKSDYKVEFYVITRKHPVGGIRLIVGDANSLRESNYNPNNPTRILVHGWMANRNSPINRLLPDAYLNRSEFNIIVVDWSEAAETYDFFAARKRMKGAAEKVAEMIDFLSSRGGADPSTVYLIGHSLGAHMCGLAGSHVRVGRVGVIVALDAALPLFSKFRNDRLSKVDADHIISIHTNAGNLGIQTPIGDASFYPNWGRKQPGCGLDTFAGCSHRRAVQYWAESLSPSGNKFIAQKCKTFSDILESRCRGDGSIFYMGGDPVDTTYRGVFYLPTYSRHPFGTGSK